jgi:D-alanyl-D-alanine carboxypeptidase
MRRPRRFAAIAGAVALAATTLGAITITPSAVAAPLASPKADIVVDAANGRILVADGIHTPVHAASTAKIMTALTAVERLCPGSLVTANAQDAAVETMRIGLPVNKPWPFDQMMASMMMVSANDAAYAFANTVGGSLDGFAKDLAATAKQLGLRDSTLNDPAGIDDETSYKGGPLMSAYDLAIATRNALTVPEIAQWSAMHHYSFTDPSGTVHDLVNHNKMLPGGGADYPGAIGFKTGFTQLSQHTLVAVATRNGRTLIAVVLGVPDSGYQEAASLLDAGFATPANTKGAGQSLPPVKVSRCGVRAADQAAFAKLGASVNGVTGLGTTGTTGATVPAVVPVFNQAPLAGRTTSAHPKVASTVAKHHSPGLLRPRNLIIVLILVLATVFFVRRRAVKRQRAIRLARRRQRNSAMRSGGLPVVDGRYRAGNRIGPPVESHVRVRPARRPGRPDPA